MTSADRHSRVRGMDCVIQTPVRSWGRHCPKFREAYEGLKPTTSEIAMHTITTRHWEFEYAAVFRRWVPNCRVCQSDHRERIEDYSLTVPVWAHGYGFYPRLLRVFPNEGLSASSLRNHFKGGHFPLTKITAVTWSVATEAGHRIGVDAETFDEAIEVVKAEYLIEHEEDWEAYMAGPPDDTRHLLSHRPRATKRLRSSQDPMRPSTQIRPEWGTSIFSEPGLLYRVMGIKPPPAEALEDEVRGRGIFDFPTMIPGHFDT